MMTTRQLFFYSLTVLLAVLLLFSGTLAARAADATAERITLILCDVSGSMQDKIQYKNPDGKESKVAKVKVMKQMLVRLTEELPETTCNMGIYLVRHKAGNPDLYESFVAIGRHERNRLADYVKDNFETDYPVFNRRTPLADMLRQFNDKELKDTDRPMTLLLISDGKDSFYDSDDNDGPLAEVRNLKQHNESNFTLHTVYIGEPEDDEFEQDMKDIAEAGSGDYYAGYDLSDNALFSTLSRQMCQQVRVAERKQEEPPVVQEPQKTEPKPEPEKIDKKPAAAVIVDTDNDGVRNEKDTCPDTPGGIEVDAKGCPIDSDGDGVYDFRDKCPGTPLGAHVNPYGCWVLNTVLFDYNKDVVKPSFYKELQSVVNILEKNPELKIEVQGHTDNIGSARYNRTLSDKRAKAVMEYFIQQGVASGRLSYKGYGFDKPVVPNTNDANRALNRRVELQPKQ